MRRKARGETGTIPDLRFARCGWCGRFCLFRLSTRTFMKILLVGSGAREHALAWKIRQSPLCGRLFIAPGNPGMEGLGELVPVKANDVAGLVRAAQDLAVELVVVGPEDPLALGLVDALAEKKIKAFGPSRAGAQLEADKGFAKKM